MLSAEEGIESLERSSCVGTSSSDWQEGVCNGDEENCGEVRTGYLMIILLQLYFMLHYILCQWCENRLKYTWGWHKSAIFNASVETRRVTFPSVLIIEFFIGSMNSLCYFIEHFLLAKCFLCTCRECGTYHWNKQEAKRGDLLVLSDFIFSPGLFTYLFVHVWTYYMLGSDWD